MTYKKPSLVPMTLGGAAIGGIAGASYGAYKNNNINNFISKEGEVTDSFAKTTFEKYINHSAKEGKEALIKKYEAQLTQKKKSIKDSYAKKVTEVDKNLDDLISAKAKAMGYDLVFRKDSLLFGGTDITAQILPSVK